MTRQNKGLIVVMSLIMVLTIVFYVTDIDMNIARYVYRTFDGFHRHVTPWYYLYKYGIYPPVLCFIAATLLLGGAYFSKVMYSYRKQALFVVLAMIIGPGLLSNAIFKDYYGRPRPRQIKEFGGDANFLKIWVKGDVVPEEDNKKYTGLDGSVKKIAYSILPQKGKYNSFPSGHASVAFFMMFFYFLFRRTRWRYLLLTAGIGYGILMGITRIVQGGHFASDVLWAFAFNYITMVVLSRSLLSPNHDDDKSIELNSKYKDETSYE